MTLMRCTTHVVKCVASAIERYARDMDYIPVEEGRVAADLAEAWASPASAGRAYAVMQPASGAQSFLRFVEGEDVPDYAPIRTYGWAATELCVTNVEDVHERMIASRAFEVIGAPRPLDGFSTVKPMQVRGPDREIVYLTQVLVDGPAQGLPNASSAIDRPFITVLACRDLPAAIGWFRDVALMDVGEPVAIRYTMISRAFGRPIDEKHELAMCRLGGEKLIELDQYPEQATGRPSHPGALPPGIAGLAIVHPGFARLEAWLSPPRVRSGPVYGDRQVGVMKTPDGALLEVIDGAPAG